MLQHEWTLNILFCVVWIHLYKMSKIVKSRESERRLVVSQGWVWEEWKVTANNYSFGFVFFLGEKKYSEIRWWWWLYNPVNLFFWNAYFKWVNCMACELKYLNKVLKAKVKEANIYWVLNRFPALCYLLSIFISSNCHDSSGS